MNYGELKTAIQFFAEEDEAEWVADIPRYIELSERKVWMELIPLDPIQATFNQAGAFTVGANTLSVASNNAVDVKFFNISSSASTDGPWESLLEKDHSFAIEAFPDRSAAANAKPRYFAKNSSGVDPASLLLEVFPPPDIAYRYDIEYYGIPTSITAGLDSGSTWLSEMSPDSMLYGALVSGYTAMKGEADVMQMYATLFESALNDLKGIIVAQNKGDAYRTGQNVAVGKQV